MVVFQRIAVLAFGPLQNRHSPARPGGVSSARNVYPNFRVSCQLRDTCLSGIPAKHASDLLIKRLALVATARQIP